MTARRASSDPVSKYLQTGERVVWRHQPAPRALFFNRLPAFILILLFIAFAGWMLWQFVTATLADFSGPWGVWLVVPFVFLLFLGALLSSFLSFAWGALRNLLDSWNTHYALTDRRFMIVSERGLIEYGAELFAKMEPLGGKAGEHVLLLDWGPAGKHKREQFRERIAALPDSRKLEKLIRETLKPPALEAAARRA